MTSFGLKTFFKLFGKLFGAKTVEKIYLMSKHLNFQLCFINQGTKQFSTHS